MCRPVGCNICRDEADESARTLHVCQSCHSDSSLKKMPTEPLGQDDICEDDLEVLFHFLITFHEHDLILLKQLR